MLKYFTEAVSFYGIPSRVRCDHGGENNDVCTLMEVLRGDGRGSALRGASTHNQRIERSWVDMWCGVTNLYYDLFFLEDEGILDLDNEVHIWALHYVYLPRINRDLVLFVDQWNHHGLRTEHYKSPLQIFVKNILRLQGSNLTAIQDMFGHLDVAVVHPPPGLDLNELVEVPPTPLPLNNDQLNHLRQQVDPLDDSYDELGISLYSRTVAYIDSI